MINYLYPATHFYNLAARPSPGTILAIQGGDFATNQTGKGKIILDIGMSGKQDIDIKLQELAGSEAIVQGGTYTIKNHGAGAFNVDLTAKGDQKATVKGNQDALVIIQGGKYDITNDADGDLGFKLRQTGNQQVKGLMLI